MEKRHYKTLRGLLSQTLYGQINFIDFHWGMFYHKKKGHVNFTLDDEDTFYAAAAAAVYSRPNDEKKARMQKYHGRPHGILNDIMVRLTKKGVRGEFNAGQEYTSELRCVQGIFRNGD